MLGIILAFLTAICFGLSTAIQKYALDKMKKFTIKGMIENKRWLSSLLVGALGVLFYLLALRTAELSIVQSVLSLALVIPMIIGFAVFKEKLVLYEWLAIILIVVGIFLTMF